MANLLNSEPSLEVDANSKSRKWELKVQVEHGGGGDLGQPGPFGDVKANSNICVMVWQVEAGSEFPATPTGNNTAVPSMAHGYVAMSNRCTKAAMSKLLDIAIATPSTCNWSPVTAHDVGAPEGKSPTLDQIFKFLGGHSEGNRSLERGPWVEKGNFGQGGRPSQGQGAEEEEIRDALHILEESKTLEEAQDKIKEKNIKLWWKNPSRIEKAFVDMKRRKMHDEVIAKGLKEGELNEWQRGIVDMVKGEPHNRHIHWYFDQGGCRGKSMMSNYLRDHFKAYITGGDARARDIMYGYDELKYSNIVVFNFARAHSKEAMFSDCFATMEDFKNGSSFSSKYEAREKVFPTCHVLVFANAKPSPEVVNQNFTPDRLIFEDLSKFPEYSDKSN